jgi:GTP-binding protein
VGGYLAADRNLVGVVVIMDARHPLTPLDLRLIEWLGEQPLVVLLSKADKLSRTEQAHTLSEVQHRLSRHTATLFSSVTKQGVEESRGLLERWLEAGRENKKPPVKGM